MEVIVTLEKVDSRHDTYHFGPDYHHVFLAGKQRTGRVISCDLESVYARMAAGDNGRDLRTNQGTKGVSWPRSGLVASRSLKVPDNNAVGLRARRSDEAVEWTLRLECGGYPFLEWFLYLIVSDIRESSVRRIRVRIDGRGAD
jgi:hypothetical protein